VRSWPPNRTSRADAAGGSSNLNFNAMNESESNENGSKLAHSRRNAGSRSSHSSRARPSLVLFAAATSFVARHAITWCGRWPLHAGRRATATGTAGDTGAGGPARCGRRGRHRGRRGMRRRGQRARLYAIVLPQQRPIAVVLELQRFVRTLLLQQLGELRGSSCGGMHGRTSGQARCRRSRGWSVRTKGTVTV
jgi:hypothetical protein